MQSSEGIINFFDTIDSDKAIRITTVYFSLDDVTVKIPRRILSAASPVLAAILKNDYPGKSFNCLCISEFTSKDFDKFLYRAILCQMGVNASPCTSSEAVTLLPLAHFYQQDELIELLKLSIIQSPTVEGVVALAHVGIDCEWPRNAIQKLCKSSFILDDYNGMYSTLNRIMIKPNIKKQLRQLPVSVLADMIEICFNSYSFSGVICSSE